MNDSGEADKKEKQRSLLTGTFTSSKRHQWAVQITARSQVQIVGWGSCVGVRAGVGEIPGGSLVEVCSLGQGSMYLMQVRKRRRSGER